MAKAYEGNKGLTIKMTKTQLTHNKEIEGGFLPALAGLIPFLAGTVLPALGVGTLSGLASMGVQKLFRNGLYFKKGIGVCWIETNGDGLYLGPVNDDGFYTLRNGLYLKR